MTQFHEGQEVEVRVSEDGQIYREWRKAKIAYPVKGNFAHSYFVQFPDGTRVVFDTEHIRAISPLDERFSRAPTTEAEHLTELAGDSAEEYPGLAEPDDDTSDPMGGEVSK